MRRTQRVDSAVFVDRVRIRLTSGSGGNGCCSFRREKYVPLGGPNGGDGGNGGDVVLEASARMTSLLDVRYHSHWRGERGEHGQGSDCHGKNSPETVVHVPCGTLVLDAESGDLLCDLTEPGQRFLAARGGRGGRGNARFTTSTNRAPKFAEKGEPGEEREFILELKLIADVGLVGLPNAGKSTLLSHVTAARPKIADYPFTTLSPNLGVVQLDGYRTLTMADIPGIIEGAAEGKGLGHDFLRHIERTRVLVFLIDLGDPDPRHTLEILENELAKHSPVFAERPRFVALNKADVTENRERFEALRETLPNARLVSGVTGEGLSDLLEDLWREVERAREMEAGRVDEEPEHEYTFEAAFKVFRVPGGYRIDGTRPVRAVRMTDFENPEAVRHLQQVLTKMGVFKALKRLGAHPGQTILVGDLEMEYSPDEAS